MSESQKHGHDRSRSADRVERRLPELRALLRWIVHSWFRSADSETGWEQSHTL